MHLVPRFVNDIQVFILNKLGDSFAQFHYTFIGQLSFWIDLVGGTSSIIYININVWKLSLVHLFVDVLVDSVDQ